LLPLATDCLLASHRQPYVGNREPVTEAGSPAVGTLGVVGSRTMRPLRGSSLTGTPLQKPLMQAIGRRLAAGPGV